MNGLARVVVVPPQASRAVGVEAGVVGSTVLLRVIQDGVEDAGRVDDPRLDGPVLLRECLDALRQDGVVRLDADGLLELVGLGAGIDVLRRAVDRRDGEEDEFARAGVVQLLDVGEVAVHGVG